MGGWVGFLSCSFFFLFPFSFFFFFFFSFLFFFFSFYFLFLFYLKCWEGGEFFCDFKLVDYLLTQADKP